ncbi:MAG: glycerol-3-phosphate 1-O-acyltransferase PlsY [Defluviitaleaceae bacterium]|nr:glycerol-3-phosphate 1-O-acyltransferase PlsY [Defluviitaleaceae bacterium]
MYLIFRILALLIGYGFGMIQIAYIIGKIKGIDIREHGSGNAGTTNVVRVLGFKTGFFVFVVDILKAVAAFLVIVAIFPEQGVVAGIYAGLGVVLGHCFPFYLNFRGGKGMASTAGLIIVIDPLMGLTIMAVGVGVVIFTRYVSLASLIVIVITPLFLYIYAFPTEVVLVSVGIGTICFYMHRGNIGRLIKGTERKIFDKTAK